MDKNMHFSGKFGRHQINQIQSYNQIFIQLQLITALDSWQCH